MIVLSKVDWKRSVFRKRNKNLIIRTDADKPFVNFSVTFPKFIGHWFWHLFFTIFTSVFRVNYSNSKYKSAPIDIRSVKKLVAMRISWPKYARI